MGRGLPPAYIFSILPDRVMLSGDLSAIFRLLRASRYRDQTARETPSAVAVSFPAGVNSQDTAERDQLLRWLSDRSVAFAEKHPGPGSIASFARRLQETGALPSRIAVIRWSSQDEWRVVDQSFSARPSVSSASV
jgi:hypothetical protein